MTFPSAPSPKTTALPYRVMVVDDSAVIRSAISRALQADPEIKVVASAVNGQHAIEQIKTHDVDLVVLDIEMPEMDGLTALPLLLKERPAIKIIIASTLSKRNADISMQALQLGASDYIPKPSAEEMRNPAGAKAFEEDLIQKVKTLAANSLNFRIRKRQESGVHTAGIAEGIAKPSLSQQKTPIALRPWPRGQRIDAVAIGSSTGGPQALFEVLKSLSPGFRQPIFLTQHMPATFTAILAEHIQRQCLIRAKEAENGEAVMPSQLYIAPGGYHMLVENKGGARIAINQDPPENFCRPAVDPMLRSLVKFYGGNLLVLILTGMGYDGQKGCDVVVKAGGSVFAQDEESSVVWGMPGAVANAGLCSEVLPLSQIGPRLFHLMKAGG